MPEKLVWHIGLPKTGTSYLQQVIWNNRAVLAERGVQLPGFGHREHLWAALGLAEEARLERRDPRAPGAWQRLVEQVHEVEGTALLTHEFFASATAEQAARGREAFGDLDVHLVITARDAASMLRAGWQEFVKNGGQRSLADMAQREDPHQFSWWLWDLGNVLKRWAPVVAPDRVHIVPVPPRGAAPDQHWVNFAQVLGIDPAVDLPTGTVNASLDVVQVEALRHANRFLGEFRSPRDRGQWIRGHLAEGLLAEQASDRLGLGPELLAQCEQRTARALDLIETAGHRIVGDRAGLRVPAEAAGGRSVESVRPEEINDSLGALVGGLLGQVREARSEAKQLRHTAAREQAEREQAEAEAASSSWFRRR